jgi:dipeptidyl aminopeptidase/acylaminoacyl peptidase
LHQSTLLWVEALDGGDPTRKVPFRDKLIKRKIEEKGVPAEVLTLQHRYAGFGWFGNRDEVLLTEYDRDKRWRTSYFINLQDPSGTKRTLFDLSVNDAYNDPGQPVYATKPNGENTILQDGDWIFLNGRGASEEGDRPLLQKMNLKTLKKEKVFQSKEKALQRFSAFAPGSLSKIIVRHESQTEPPNFSLADLNSNSWNALTNFTDPAPQLTGMKKELIKYQRADGVQLSGTLYLPANYKPGTKLPCLVWAYPQEYSDPATGGQVRGSPHTFTFFRGTSQLFFVTQGYAVLNDATMPVIGDPETMNNTFVEQIVAAAKAAIDKLDTLGVIDKDRVFVGGHSYGAFMTANLLAHSDLFAAGIARSGAYNRSLTPFGFQSERRSFWEATDTYMRVSPFTHAHRINEPILLIHGEADNNQGTFPIQSERLFQAIKGNGGIARLVMLPYESHGYSARESVLHVLAESFEWAERFVKSRKAQTGSR